MSDYSTTRANLVVRRFDDLRHGLDVPPSLVKVVNSLSKNDPGYYVTLDAMDYAEGVFITEADLAAMDLSEGLTQVDLRAFLDSKQSIPDDLRWLLTHGAERLERLRRDSEKSDAEAEPERESTIVKPPRGADDLSLTDVGRTQFSDNERLVLCALRDSNEPLTHSAEGSIERATSLEKSSVGRALKRLRHLGLVAKVTGARGFVLTPQGTAIAENICE